MPPCVFDYILCIQYLIFKQKYITSDHMLTVSNIFIELKSSTLVSNLYGFMRRISYLFSFASYCSITVPLVKHRIITKGPLYGVSHFICSVFSEHEFISDFIVTVNFMFILFGVISINLRLFLLTY